MKVLFSSAVLDKQSGADKEMKKIRRKIYEKIELEIRRKKLLFFNTVLDVCSWAMREITAHN